MGIDRDAHRALSAVSSSDSPQTPTTVTFTSIVMAIIIIIPASSDRVGHVAAWGFRSASQTLNYTGVTWRPCHKAESDSGGV